MQAFLRVLRGRRPLRFHSTFADEHISLFRPLAFPLGESGFCERSEQKTREVLTLKSSRALSAIYVCDLFRQLR